jgi:glycine/D-amino acid oxidase-like deaminating enzyme
MNLRSTQSLWMNLGEECLVRPSLERSVECDVLIVGSGITGALIAYHLAEQNLDVVVIDRRDLACGSTPASTALLQYDIDTPLVELRKCLGRPHADAAYFRSRQSLSDLSTLIHRAGIKCGLNQRPSLYLARAESDLSFLKDEFEARLEIGLEVGLFNNKRLRSQFHVDRPGAIVSRVAYQLDPWRLTKQLLVAAERRGARVFAQTALLPVEAANPLINHTHAGHLIGAEHVVWATG